MLQELRIKNFAIIDELDLSFSRGFNILTGETGAGKSIILNAVQLLLGDRASEELIRSSEEEASVEALFDISENREVKGRIHEEGQRLSGAGGSGFPSGEAGDLTFRERESLHQWESCHAWNAFGDWGGTPQHLWSA